MALYQIKEFGKLCSRSEFPNGTLSDKDVAIPDSSFQSIWNYILEFQNRDPDVDKAFKLYTRNGKKIIQAQNYVGLIETSTREVVEILPKIHSERAELTLAESKQIFLKMIATLRDAPYINVQQASLEIKNNYPILEIFIGAFIQEVQYLISQGLKKGYKHVENNSRFLKGQLLFSKNIVRNITDGSRFYVKYASYEEDIPQNRIIKSALKKLFIITASATNRASIGNLLSIFSNVPLSVNIETDLDKSSAASRLFAHYEKVLAQAAVFLREQSFTTFSGKHINQAILFPMEKLFESFIAWLFKRYANEHITHAQHSKYFLVNKHLDKGRFRLRPDLYIEPLASDTPCIVMDTKWKIIDQSLPHRNYLINQADMYQLYAYGRKYAKADNEPKLLLIYPMSPSFNNPLAPFYYEITNGHDHLQLMAIPFDLAKDYPQQIGSVLAKLPFDR